MSAHEDHDHAPEPIPGLPELPPQGERILWQGAPSWQGLATRVFHVRAVAIYFLVLLAWRVGGYAAMEGFPAALLAAVPLLGVSVLGVGLLLLLAWLMARTTVYTITSHRVAMRFGIALPITINVPFTVIDGAARRDHANGTADFPLHVQDARAVSWFVLWPHVRPWTLGRAEPMLRAVHEPERVAVLLGEALRAAAPAGRAGVLGDHGPGEDLAAAAR